MRVEVNGVRLFVDIVGAKLDPVGPVMREKPTLLLLHGGPGFDHSTYRPALDVLGDVAQLVYFDHRGQGRSDYGDSTQWNLNQWADDVAELCEVLEIDSPIVFGHSFGAMVAMAYATRHPQHPGRLILSGTYARQNLELIAARFFELGGAPAAEAARAFWNTPSVETFPEYKRQCLRYYLHKPRDIHSASRVIQRPDPGFHFAGGELRTMNLLPGLQKVCCPTLIIGSHGDPVCPIEGAEEIADAFTHDLVRLERIDGCRHVFWEDAPDAFLTLLRQFIERRDHA